MQPHSPANHTERARPLLGTRVAIRLSGAPSPANNALIDEAFRIVGEIHRLMSFHETGSDLHRLNKRAAHETVEVAPHTWRVLSFAQEISRASAGVFDVTVARELALAGTLPSFEGMTEPSKEASWQDVELLPGHRVRYRRPLWMDLGGIAKGYAVDCASNFLRDAGAVQGCVNAGGDLLVFGPAAEQVHLLSATRSGQMPVLEVSNAAVASSGGDGAHYNGMTRRLVDRQRLASVVAPDCMAADALSKV
ncbi:MAG: FAD:protein FMN transferase, partial [Rhizobium sp.]